MSPSYRVLIVDDEHNMRFTLRAILQELGYEVHVAPNAQSAQQKLQAQHFDIMLLDVRLPGMTGLELLAEVRRRHPFTAVIIITGYGTVTQAVAAIRGGAVNFLQKPVSPYEINEALETALQNPLAPPADMTYDDLLAIASHCLQREEWRAAQLAIQHALTFDPARHEAYSLLGAWHELRGDEKLAQRFFGIAHWLREDAPLPATPQSQPAIADIDQEGAA